VAAAATSLLSLCGSAAFADSNADGAASGSPGVLSGNNVQAPVNVPVNICGNSVNAVGLLNPVFGNSCAHDGAGSQAVDGVASQSVGQTADSPGVVSGNEVQVPVSVPVNACGNSVNVVGLLNNASDNSCAHDGVGSQAVSGIPSQPAPADDSTVSSGDSSATSSGTGSDTSSVSRADQGATQPAKVAEPPCLSPQATCADSPSTTSFGRSAESTDSGDRQALAETGGGNVLGASAASAALIVGGTLVLYRRRRATGLGGAPVQRRTFR